jgi:hypothetical protein
MIITTDQPTVILDRGARHIDAGETTLCGHAITATSVRFPATDGQRISCSSCAVRA